MIIKEIAEIITTGNIKKEDKKKPIDLVLSSGLKENNALVIEKIIDNSDYDSKVIIDDIVIKRVSPRYVNIIEKERDGVYYGTNLIVIRVCSDKYYPKYIAQLISKNLSMLESLSNSGTRFYSINRRMLENVSVPNIDYKEQVIIGNLWNNINKQNRLFLQLLEKNETIKKIIEERL